MNHRVEDEPGERVADLGLDVAGDGGPFDHRQNDPAELQSPVVQIPTNLVDRGLNLTESRQAEERRRDRDEDLVDTVQRVDGEERGRGRRVDQRDVEPILEVVERKPKPALATELVHKSYVGFGQAGRRGDEEEILAEADDRGVGRRFAHDDLVSRGRGWRFSLERDEGDVRLGVEVDDQRLRPGPRQARGDVDRAGRLADPTLRRN